MAMFFREGGIAMYPTLLFGLLLLSVGVAFALQPERRLISVFAVLAVVDFVSGALGTTLGAIATFMAAARVPPGQQYALTLAGLAESLNNLALALGLLVLASLALSFGALRSALAAGPEPK